MAQGLQLSDFKRTNYKLIIGVGLVVLGLVFLPDLLNFSGSKKVEKVKVEEEDLIPEEVPNTTNKTPTEEELLELVNNGYIDRMADLKAAQKAGEDGVSKTTEADVMYPEPITWKNIKSAKSIKTLQEARKLALVLADQVPVDRSKSRFALYNFSNGIQSVVAAKEDFDPIEVLKYLETLDLEVSHTLAREAVERDVLMQWSKISISSVLGSKRTERLKGSIVPSFNPDLQLQQVSLEFIPRQSSESRPIDRSGYTVSFSVSFRGGDVKAINIYHNNHMIKNISANSGNRGSHNNSPAPVAPAITVLSQVDVRNEDGGGSFSVVATDKYGYQAVKYYRFIPKNIRKLPWKYNQSSRKYVLNLRGVTEAARGQIDRIFVMGSSDPQDSNIFLPSGSGKYEIF